MFGALIKQKRIEKGLTQIELAESVGVTQSCIAHIERGKRKPTFKTLFSLADILELSLNELKGANKCDENT